METTQRQYSTGLPFLDRRIDGGIEAGSLLALTAPPPSQSELFLRQLLDTRRTLYVSTTRPAEEVRTWAGADSGSVPDLMAIHESPEALLADPTRIERHMTPESFVILDRANGLETAPRGEYLAFLNDVATFVRESHSVAVLHCSETPRNPPRRELTLDRVDQVWQLELLKLSREIKNRLLVTKSRRSRALREPIDLILTDRVQVDTSRKI